MKEDKTCIRVYADEHRLNLCAEKLNSAETMIQELSQVLSLAGSETRLKILYLLEEEGELCVCDLSDVLQMTMSAVSQQLRKLKDGGIIQSKKSRANDLLLPEAGSPENHKSPFQAYQQ